MTPFIAGTNAEVLKATYDDLSDPKHVQEKRDELLASLKQMLPGMTKDNTVILGVLAESPYAEFMGDINSVYCKETTEFVEGCLYNSHANDYMP
jgi:hypothetical protein